jgi:hypothetical protein
MSKIATMVSTAAGAALFAGAALADPAPHIPVFGHYIGYGTVTSATAEVCPDTTGTNYMEQLELNTPGERLVVKTRRVTYGADGPAIALNVFDNSSGTRLAPAGAVTIRTEGVTGVVTGNFTGTLTPLDPNSFGATFTITYTADGQSSPCQETQQLVFIRSSAD